MTSHCKQIKFILVIRACKAHVIWFLPFPPSLFLLFPSFTVFQLLIFFSWDKIKCVLSSVTLNLLSPAWNSVAQIFTQLSPLIIQVVTQMQPFQRDVSPYSEPGSPQSIMLYHITLFQLLQGTWQHLKLSDFPHCMFTIYLCPSEQKFLGKVLCLLSSWFYSQWLSQCLVLRKYSQYLLIDSLTILTAFLLQQWGET